MPQRNEQKVFLCAMGKERIVVRKIVIKAVEIVNVRQMLYMLKTFFKLRN